MIEYKTALFLFLIVVHCCNGIGCIYELLNIVTSTNKSKSQLLVKWVIALVQDDLTNLSIENEVHISYYTQLTREERYHISVLCKV